MLHTWLRLVMSFGVAQRVYSACSFEIVNAASLQSGFEEARQRPLLIRGLSWKTEFASRAGFRKAFGNVTAFLTKNIARQARTGKPPGKMETTFGKWVDQLDSEGGVPYVFHFCVVHPNCDSSIEATYGIPQLMRGSAARLFIAAGAKTKGIALHAHDRTWGAAISGQKVWYVAPPGQPPVEPYRHWEENELAAAKLLQCTQEEGDVVYLPDQWWHATFCKQSWALTIGGQGNSEGLVYDAARGNVGSLQNMQAEMMDQRSWQSAATHAAYNGHVAVLEALSTKGVVDLSAKSDGGTLLHHAAYSGHTKAVTFLASVPGVNMSTLDTSGGTLAHSAAGSGNANMIELLTELGVDMSVQNAVGATPGHFAGVNGHAQIIELLANKGVDMSAKDGTGRTVGHAAAMDGHARIVDILGRKSGVDLSAKDNRGLTLGHYAAKDGHVEVLEVMANNGISLSAADVNGATALHHAAHFNQTRVIKFLLDKGVDPSVKEGAAIVAAKAGHSPPKVQSHGTWDAIMKWWRGATSGEL